MSDEHFSVDGTLIQAWASHKSFQPKSPPPPGDAADPPLGAQASAPADPPPPLAKPGRNQARNWRGQKRSNETHASVTDPDARLARKSSGTASILAYAGHVLMENRNGLVSQACLTPASGTAERDAALTLVDRQPGRWRITLGADKGYDAQAFIADLRRRRVTPHVSANRSPGRTGQARRSAIDRRTTRHPGYAASQRIRKRIEMVCMQTTSSA